MCDVKNGHDYGDDAGMEAVRLERRKVEPRGNGNSNGYKGKMTVMGILLVIFGAVVGGMVQDYRIEMRQSPVTDATLVEGVRGLRQDVSRLGSEHDQFVPSASLAGLRADISQLQTTLDAVEVKTEDRYKGRDAERDFQKVDQQFVLLSDKISDTRDRVNRLSERTAVVEANFGQLDRRVETLKDWVVQHSQQNQSGE